MSAGVKYSTLPENADKILFAEDFMNHILSKLNLPLLSSGIADHRALTYNAFDSEIRLAINSCYSDHAYDSTYAFERFSKKKRRNINSFIKYVEYFKSRLGTFVPDCPKAREFLRLCVKLSIMAGKFYMHNVLDAPDLAIGHIVSIIEDTDMVEEGGWEALNNVARDWSQFYVGWNKICLTPDSNASNSPNHENEDGEETEEEESSDEEYRKVFYDSSSSSDEPFFPSSVSIGFRKTYGGKACNIVTSENASDSASVGSSKKKNSETSFHSFQNITKEDDNSIQNDKKDRNEEPSCSYSKESKFNAKKCKIDVQITDDIVPFNRQLTDERVRVFISQELELYKSDTVRRAESDNLTAENVKTSSTEDRNQTSVAESGRRKKSVPKKRKIYATKR